MEKCNSIMKNNVWKFVPRPKGKSVVTSRWLYKLKYATDGIIEKYKARFVARGFHRLRELIMMRPSLRLLDIPRSGQ
jgi:hypothetical protein